MVGALKTLHTYRGDSKLSSWLIAIFRFKAITQLKRQKKMVPLDSVMPDPESADEGNVPSVLIDTPVEKYATPQQIARLQTAIDALSDEHRQVIQLFYLEERSVVEITALLGIPEPTVKTRLFYAREKLRAKLKGSKITN
jgi:RNA polymerase sigma-70 factor (ECF subfamily)